MTNDLDAIHAHYNLGLEHTRLEQGLGELERERTRELIARFAPDPPAVICDIGGAAGIHARWLAGGGYDVHLLDLVPLHIEQARDASARDERPIASFTVGDARSLPYADGFADVVLLLGPLYHLVERGDRVQAIREAARVLRSGGVVIAAGISRYASLMDGLRRGLVDDPEFRDILRDDLGCGVHRNPENHPDYFTTAYMHEPGELADEVVDAGLEHRGTFAVQGPAWLFDGFEARWADVEKRESLLELIRSIECAPALLGASAHLLAIGVRV